MIDSHAHLNDARFAADLDAVLARAREAGVERVVCPGTDMESSRALVELARRREEVFAAVGFDRDHADQVNETTLAELERLATEANASPGATHLCAAGATEANASPGATDLDAGGSTDRGAPGAMDSSGAVPMDSCAAGATDSGAACAARRCVAIGEIGLDYHYDRLPRDVQRRAFEAQLDLARRLDLPVIVHCRDAWADAFDILAGAGVQGVIHCFSGDVKAALRACELGLLISFAGQVTYPKAGALADAARAAPAEHLLVETDSPYLPPQALRGRRNEPAYLVHTVRFLADALGLSFEDVARITASNARLLFRLPGADETALVYPIRDSLYVNVTNQCTNRCVFCPRSTRPRVKGHWLGMSADVEPSAPDLIAAIGDPKRYDEIVFCGFGEPTLRLDVMLDVARWVKERGGRTRLNTNGQGDLIAGGPIAPRLAGLIDAVSVSLNTADAGQYAALCRSEHGGRAFAGVVEFIRSARSHGADVTVTTLDYPGIDVDAVKRLAESLGVRFRLRQYRHLG